MKIGSDRAEVRAVLERDGRRCVACGFDLQCALAVHHRVSKELGGRDTPSNLITLCANCHKVAHSLSVGRRLSGPEGDHAKRHYPPGAFAVLSELAKANCDHRTRTRQAGNQWIEQRDTEGLMSLSDALSLVSRKNHFDDSEVAMLRDVTNLVFRHLPADVLAGCSVRVIQKGRFLSVNAGNINLFRVPGLFDGAKDPEGDILLIWPKATPISVIRPAEWRKIAQSEVRFAALPCFNVPLDFEEVLELSPADWATFTGACRDAVNAPKSRQWVSNVIVK